MSRRGFIKGAALAGLAGGTLGLAGCGQPQAQGSAKVFTPGTYTARVTGHNAPFDVVVTFTEHAIASIDTSSSLESPGVGRYALDSIADDIISSQSLDVDTVTGATLSSMALLQGVEDCRTQAGGAELEGARPAKEQESALEADVCVVGGGGAGIVVRPDVSRMSRADRAALAARAERGERVKLSL